MRRSNRSNWIAHAALRVAAWCMFMFGGSVVSFGAEAAKEYQIKAAFLYNFTRYIEWPSSRFVAPDSPIVIGVLGKSRFGDELQSITRGHRINGREIAIVSVTSASEQRSVHVLFVCADSERFLALQPGAGVLTVGESERFAAIGGMITFISEGNKVRFMINLDRSSRAKLKISSQLLKLASTVRRKG